MTDPKNDAQPRDDERFSWHPHYQGQTVGEVRATLTGEIRSDQRSYGLAIDGPDENEAEILTRVVGLERRWGPYAMDWATTDPAAIADRVVQHEWVRDIRRELFPYSELRDGARPAARSNPSSVSAAAAGGNGPDGDRPWWAFWRR